MVAVGCLFIKSREASPREVLKDLVEMCKASCRIARRL
jgi:vacuolar protein sorting-associated protein 35